MSKTLKRRVETLEQRSSEAADTQQVIVGTIGGKPVCVGEMVDFLIQFSRKAEMI